MKRHAELIELDSLLQDALAKVVEAQKLAAHYQDAMSDFRHKWWKNTVPCRSYTCLEKIDDNCSECGGFGRTPKTCKSCKFYTSCEDLVTKEYDYCKDWIEWSSATCPWCRYRPGGAGCEGKPVKGMLCESFSKVPESFYMLCESFSEVPDL